jgi:hypothetical protein
MGLSQTPQALVPAAFTSGSITLLSTTTLTGNNVTISNISQDYVNLYILITGVTNATADGGLRMLPNSTSSNAITGKVVDTNYNQTGLWSITFEQNMGRASANNAFGLNINDYTSSTTLKPISWSGYYDGPSAVPKYVTGGGGYYDSAAITSLFFYHGGGAFLTGTVKVYGVK